MKKILCLLLFAAAVGCRKNADNDGRMLLKEIKTSSGMSQSFEYNNGVLAREYSYTQFCPNSTPVDEHTYVYQAGKLVRMENKLRSFYSSTTALCDPASGIRMDEEFEYDAQGRISKVIRQLAYTIFEYNASDLVTKQVIYGSNGTAYDSTVFTYDIRGNIVKETDSHGYVRNYEYDNRTNPMYQIKQKPGLITAFNSSPNNVIRSTDNFGGFERRILSYTNNMPSRVEEGGAIYTYVYQ